MIASRLLPDDPAAQGAVITNEENRLYFFDIFKTLAIMDQLFRSR